MLTFEQPTSAHRALRGARILHGDTTAVRVAAGSVKQEDGRTHLAFCSSWVERGRVLNHGSRVEHGQVIGGDIVFENPEAIEQVVQGRPGIVIFEGSVHTNGCVRFSVDPTSVRLLPVRPHQQSLVRWESGRSLVKTRLLEETAAS